MKNLVLKLLLPGFLFFSFSIITTQKVSAAGTFDIFPSSGNYLRSCNQSVDINIDVTSGQSNAADIIVTYDTTKIDIIDALPGVPGTQILPGNAFETYAGNSVNTLTGEIKLVGYSSSNDLTADATFASILFKSKPLAINGGFTITFTGANPYNTLDSNIADSTTSFDMLSGVTNSSYTFSSGTCATDATPPSITFESPTNLQNNVQPNAPVTIKIADSGSGVALPTVQFVINGITYTATSPEVTISGSPANYTFTITPVTPFPTNSVSVISVISEDAAGNEKTSSISINSGYSCPVTTVVVPGSCPAITPTKAPDRVSPVVIVKSTTTINLTKDYALVITTTDENGLAPESFILTLGKQTYSIAGTPDQIKVDGNKNNYTFTISLIPEELTVNEEGKLVGSIKISDLEGNTRIEQLILQTTGKLPNIGGTTKNQSTWPEAIGKIAVFYVLPGIVGAYLLAYGVLSTGPTIAYIVDSNKKPIRFPRGYIVDHNGTKKRLFGGFTGRLHGRKPREPMTLVIQKYGYNTISTQISYENSHESPRIVVTRLTTKSGKD
ncbi:hypothetical protein IT418_03100 [bacterium]|nr:hypothetical protein [bacterium]